METVLLECKEQSKVPEIRFIRKATPAPSIAVFLASDRQLNDLKRFCTDDKQFCVLGVDTTFSCGKFLVTVITYRHLQLESDTAKIGRH